MPAKPSILNIKHIGIIGLITILAVIISIAPLLYEKITGEPVNQSSPSDSTLSPAGANNNDLIQYFFSIINVKSVYYFPIISAKPVYYFPIISRAYEYFVQPESPVYITNFAHPESGCNWAGVAGQVFDKNGNPVTGYTLVVSGTIGGQSVSLSGMTGTAQTYGIGGYEVWLAGAPFSSAGTLSLSLLDAGLKQKAAPVPLTTYQDCQMNLIIINYYSR